MKICFNNSSCKHKSSIVKVSFKILNSEYIFYTLVIMTVVDNIKHFFNCGYFEFALKQFQDRIQLSFLTALIRTEAHFYNLCIFLQKVISQKR